MNAARAVAFRALVLGLAAPLSFAFGLTVGGVDGAVVAFVVLLAGLAAGTVVERILEVK